MKWTRILVASAILSPFTIAAALSIERAVSAATPWETALSNTSATFGYATDGNSGDSPNLAAGPALPMQYFGSVARSNTVGPDGSTLYAHFPGQTSALAQTVADEQWHYTAGQPLSVFASIRPERAQQEIFFGAGEGGVVHSWNMIRLATGELYFALYGGNGAGMYSMTTTATFAANTWHKVAVTCTPVLTAMWNTGGCELYVDGVSQTVTENTGLVGGPCATCPAVRSRMGVRYDGVQPFQGSISHVAYWPLTELTAAQVQEVTDGAVGITTAPSCLAMGLDVAIGGVPVDDTTTANFGDVLDWSISVPDGVQVDGLWRVYNGLPTPLAYTGAPPTSGLEGLIQSALVFPHYHSPIDPRTTPEYGISFFELIAPGDARAQMVGPVVHSGSTIWLGNDGTKVATYLSWECHVFGAADTTPPNYGWEKLPASTGASPVGVRGGCPAVRVSPIGDPTTEDPYRFLAQSTSGSTPVLSVDASYDGGASFAVVNFAPSGSTAAFSQEIPFDATTYPSPGLWEFSCTELRSGGATSTVDLDVSTSTITPDGWEDGANQESGCYQQSGMSLTNPLSWVAGAGRMGVCLVEASFVPSADHVDGFVQDVTTSTETEVPFVFGFALVDFGQSTATAMQNPQGDGCYDLGGFDIAGIDPGTACIDDAISTDATQRQWIALVIIAPLFLALCAHAFGTMLGAGRKGDA